MSSTFNLDRHAASKLLNVSLRTIDRYMATGKLSHIKSRGRVWLSKEEILKLANQFDINDTPVPEETAWIPATIMTDIPDENVIFNETKEKIFNTDFFRQEAKTDTVDMAKVDIRTVHHQEIEDLKLELNETKKKYKETKEKLTEVTSRLEQSQYRIGQLESQMATMVPLFEFQKQQEQTKRQHELAQKYANKLRTDTTSLLLTIEEKELELKEKYTEVENERFNKAVFASLVFFILLLQPVLWLLLK